MSLVKPVEAAPPVRPHSCYQLRDDCGRGPVRSGVCDGMKGNTGKVEILGNEEAGEELVEAEEEAQPVSTLPTPNMPTQSERDDHNLTHYLYRSWCPDCVEGRGIEMGHRLGDDHSDRGVAIVGFDYMFMTENNLYTRSEFGKSEDKDVDPARVLKVLVVRDMRSKAYSHMQCRPRGPMRMASRSNALLTMCCGWVTRASLSKVTTSLPLSDF